MTTAEACDLLVATTIDLSEANRAIEMWAGRALKAEQERDGYREVAVAAVHHAHDLGRRVANLEERYRRALDDARELRIQLLGEPMQRAA